MTNSSLKFVLLPAMIAVLLAGLGGLTRLTAQLTTATILGTVTDASGAVIPDAAVQVRNTGTGATLSTTSDVQGRFRVPDLGIGDYEVQASKNGFAAMIHKGITLSVGSQNVVDFALSVGQTQQAVTVEGAAVQVETTNATVSNLVDQAQMRELPLNGRNFEQLIQLAPGVQNYWAGVVNANMKQGRDPAISVAGSRPNGQAFLMDDQPLTTFYNRGLGSVTGTSLGVEAIAEFQSLTNTYGAQFGGFGAVMNAVTKSGTNGFHGSLYEFVRNSDLDARNFTDPSTVPAFRRNQFGGTIGGPVKKDKAFFFFNYEGIRQIQGASAVATVPLVRTSTATNPVTAAAVNAVLAFWPLPQYNINTTAGTGQAIVVEGQPAHENYYLGRFDYNLSDKDSFLARYFIDYQTGVYPFLADATGLWPDPDTGTNQFLNLEERHIFSPTVVNIARASFSRTNASSPLGGFAPSTNPAETMYIHPAFQFVPNAGRQDGTISVSSLTGLGPSAASAYPTSQLQNRFSEGDDIAWTRGAHNFRFGASVDRVQSDLLWPWNQAGFSFNSIPSFLAGTANSVFAVPTGLCSDACNNPVRDFREIDFAFYGQDDWKVTPRLTLNLGLRYQPTTNPIELHNLLYTVVNFATDTGLTNVPHVFITNASFHNLDPRFGFAYDLFGDHKTSIRGAFGMFHEIPGPGSYGTAFKWDQLTQTSPSGTNVITFQNPSIDGGAPILSTGGVPSVYAETTGNAWQTNRTSYVFQYNLNIQREFVQGMVLSVGYVGSRGVNLLTGQEFNPVPATLDANGVYHFAPTTVGSGRTNPALGSYDVGVNGTNSNYNSLQASLNRRLTHSVQAQLSYTYSKCMSTGDASGAGSLSANAPIFTENPYNRQYDYSVCSFNVTQALRVNSLVDLPFHGNRMIEGWQLTGILAASTGLPFNVSDGADQSNELSGIPRPNYAPNNPAATIGGVSYPACNNSPILGGATRYFNPNCFSQEAFGTLGNFGRVGLYGPDLVNLDVGILKTTKIRENMNLQFRFEVFNLLNHTNLATPNSSLFAGTPSPTTTLSRVSTAGQITTFAAPSREIQLGLKLIF